MFDVEAVKLAARSNGYEDGTCEQKNIADHGSKASKQRPKMSFLQNHEKSREILLLDVCHASWCVSRGPYCGATQPRHVGRYQPFAAVQMLPRRSLTWSPNRCGRSQRCGMAAMKLDWPVGYVSRWVIFVTTHWKNSSSFQYLFWLDIAMKSLISWVLGRMKNSPGVYLLVSCERSERAMVSWLFGLWAHPWKLLGRKKSDGVVVCLRGPVRRLKDSIFSGFWIFEYLQLLKIDFPAQLKFNKPSQKKQ